MSFMEQVKNLQIPLEHILLATKSFNEENYIGRGGFGRVYHGVLPESEPHSVVAIKRLEHTAGQGEREFMMEIALLSSYSHENLVSLVGFCDKSGEKILVYEYASNGSLEKFLHSKDLKWIQRLEICLGAARGLKYLHHDVGTQHRVIHRDIKSSNILLDENWKAKISDFGLSKIGPANIQFSMLISNACGTFGYIDPVYLNTGTLTKESDVFSFGVVLFEVLCSRLANFKCNGEPQLLFNWAREHYEKETLDKLIDPTLREQMSSSSLRTFSTIAYSCIKQLREERPTMIQVVEALEEALSQVRSLSERLVWSRDKRCLVGDLGGLINFKFTLAISRHEEAESHEEGKTAKLDEKSRIEALEIEWKGDREDRESDTDEDVLESVRPHLELKRLEIINFKGVIFSSWIFSERVFLLENLVEITLNGCDRCEQMPTLGHLSNLKKVKMMKLKKVRKIGEEFYHYHQSDVMNQFFPALRELRLEDMDMLEEWVDAKQAPSVSQVNQAFQFPNLEVLEIIRCRNLVGVPSEFPSLKKLTLFSVDNARLEMENMSRGLTCLTFLRLENDNCKANVVLEDLFKNNRRSLVDVMISNCDHLTELPNGLFTDYPAMKSLSISRCDNIEVIPDVGRESSSISLQRLEISNCKRLKALPSGIDILLPSLRSLFFRDCPLLTWLPDLGHLTGLVWLEIGGFSNEVAEIPQLPSSLETLSLWNWPKVHQLPQQRLENLSALRELRLSFMERLEALPEWLPNLSSLQKLDISCCYNLKSMPTAEATSSLKYLVIWSCPVLKERCVKGSGTDWPNIQHIPHINIS